MRITRQRAVLLAWCAGLLVLASLTLIATADSSPSATRRLFALWRGRHYILAVGFMVAAGGLLAAAVSRRALMAFIAAGLGVLGTYGALEAAGLLGLVSWPRVIAPRESPLGTKAVPHLDVKGSTYQDTAARWGLASRPIPFRYRTDRHGFRNEIDRADADIYLLGDSVLVAALVPFQETTAARLEGALGRPVMQIALIGKGPQEVHRLFRDAKVDVRGKLVIQFVFEGNDLHDSRRYFAPAAERRLPFAERTLAKQIVAVLHNLTQPVSGMAVLRTCDIGGQTYTFLRARESFAGLEGDIDALTDSLARFAAEVRGAGGTFGVVFVPFKLRVLGPLCRFAPRSELRDYAAHVGPLRDALGVWSRRSGIRLLDLTDPLQEAARAGRIPWYWGDTHWNAEGHAVAAQALADWEFVQAARAR